MAAHITRNESNYLEHLKQETKLQVEHLYNIYINFPLYE